VNDEHVLRLEWLFVSRARLPSTHKGLFVAVYVIRVDVAHQLVLRQKLEPATAPVAVGLEEGAAVVLRIGRVGQHRLAAGAAVVVTRS
jgi:hypothetical protein